MVSDLYDFLQYIQYNHIEMRLVDLSEDVTGTPFHIAHQVSIIPPNLLFIMSTHWCMTTIYTHYCMPTICTHYYVSMLVFGHQGINDLDIQVVLGKIYSSLCPELQYTASHLVVSKKTPVFENATQEQGLIPDNLPISENVPPLDEFSATPFHMSAATAATAAAAAAASVAESVAASAESVASVAVPVIIRKDTMEHVENEAHFLDTSEKSNEPKSVVRLGFVSSHFSDHSIGRMMVELFAYIHRRHHPNDDTTLYPTGRYPPPLPPLSFYA